MRPARGATRRHVGIGPLCFSLRARWPLCFSLRARWPLCCSLRARWSACLWAALVVAPAARAAAPCAGLDQLADAERTPAALEAVLAQLPPSAAPLAGQARQVLDEDGDINRAFAVLDSARADACATRTDDAIAQRQAMTELQARDERFHGVRAGDDVFDRLKHKLWLWFAALFESAALQRFATSTRFVYLAALGAAALFVGWRVWRGWRTRASASTSDERPAAETERRERFTALRQSAAGHLARGEARAALRLGQRALWARIGELDAPSVHPARTTREVVARAPAPVAEVVRAPLAMFDAAYFAGVDDVGQAREFLQAVDDAERRLTGLAGEGSA